MGVSSRGSATKKTNGRLFIFIIPFIFIIGFVIWIVYPLLPIPSGSVKGELVSFEVKPSGDFCGSYPWTKIVLNNYSATGEIPDWDNTFYFDGEYYEVEDLTIGKSYEFVYKSGSRPSDTTSGQQIPQFYLLEIK